MAINRPAAGLPEFDVASAAVMSAEVVKSVSGHLELERDLGAYAAGDQVREVVAVARKQLAELAGMQHQSVEFVDSGTNAVRLLLEAWPLDRGDVVLVPRSEFYSSRLVLDRLAATKGVSVVEIPPDGWGGLDLDYVDRYVKHEQVRLVLTSHVQSQRGIVHPIEALHDIVRRAHIPIVLDVCQAMGHVSPVTGVAAVAGTSRKWLHGPRGIGIVAVQEPWRSKLCASPSLHSFIKRGKHVCADPSKRLFEPAEAAIALRVGLATAMRQFHDAGPRAVIDRLASLGQHLRQRLRASAPAATLGEPVDERSAIVTIRDLSATQIRSLQGCLASNGLRIGWVRAGRATDVDRDIARISPAPWLHHDDLDRIAENVSTALQPAGR